MRTKLKCVEKGRRELISGLLLDHTDTWSQEPDIDQYAQVPNCLILFLALSHLDHDAVLTL